MSSAALRQPPGRHYSDTFNRALATLSLHGVAPGHAGAVVGLWARLATFAPSEPDVTLTDEEAVRFTWFGDRYSCFVEVATDGRFAWYFRDTVKPLGQSEGTEGEPAAELPARFWECLQIAGHERG